MRKPLVILCALTVALSSTAAANAAAEQTIRLTTISESERPTANGFTFTEKVYRAGKLVGRDKAVCVIEQSVANCKITVTLPEGKIVLRARISQTANQGKLTILSGTGDYAGATGTGTFKNLTEKKTRVVLNLA